MRGRLRAAATAFHGRDQANLVPGRALVVHGLPDRVLIAVGARGWAGTGDRGLPAPPHKHAWQAAGRLAARAAKRRGLDLHRQVPGLSAEPVARAADGQRVGRARAR